MVRKSLILLAVFFSFFYISSSVLAAENAYIEEDAPIEIENEESDIMKNEDAKNEGKEEDGEDQQDAVSDENEQQLKYHIGDHGDHIVQLKKDLTNLDYGHFSEDPSPTYDNETELAVTQFQADHGLTETGTADEETLVKIEEMLSVLRQEADTEESEESEEKEESDSEAGEVPEENIDSPDEIEIDDEEVSEESPENLGESESSEDGSETSEESESPEDEPEASEEDKLSESESEVSEEEGDTQTAEELDKEEQSNTSEEGELDQEENSEASEEPILDGEEELDKNEEPVLDEDVDSETDEGSNKSEDQETDEKEQLNSSQDKKSDEEENPEASEADQENSLKSSEESVKKDRIQFFARSSPKSSVLKKGVRDSRVIDLKKDLDKIGYGGIRKTNYYGSFTEKRIKQFQKYYGLTVTGAANKATLSKIESLLPNPLSKGKRHKDTIGLKKDLDKIGYGGIRKTNYYGSFTEKRIKQFQKYYGLTVTGAANKATLSKIKSLLPNPLSKGKRHKDTIGLKKDLDKIGYGGIRKTNYYGSFTEKRIKQFQKYYGLTVTGAANKATLSKIKSLLPNPLSKGKRHKDTIGLKKDLDKIGYGGIRKTNYYGSFTEKRVKQFQKYYGLTVTGAANKATLSKIKSLLPNPLSKGKRHKDTIGLKKDLDKIGYGGIRKTNYYGSFTEKRIKQFQKYYGLTVTGAANKATLSKIKSLLPNPLSKGKRHKDTIGLKKDLDKIGYGGIRKTNYYGSFTEKRIKQFQKYYGLTVTGAANKATLSKIESLLPNPLSKGKRHKDTISLKKKLNQIGYGGIKVTNYYGSFTEKRIKQFQRDYDLPVTGVADEETLAAIDKAMETREKVTYSKYDISLERALDIQMNQLQQTDQYRNKPAYISANYVTISNGVARTTANLNVRASSSTGSHIYGTLPKGSVVHIINKGSQWHKISYNTWRNPTRADVKFYLDPTNNDTFQHLDLTESAHVSARSLNNVLRGKGVLQGLGQAFIDGGNRHSVNEIYLISHALLETGNGSSNLANGIKVGKNNSGHLELVNSSNKHRLTSIKTTYNMFGIGAADSDPKRLGAFTAYKEGWFSPEAAIRGGAKFIGSSYLHNQYYQNTLYKMRWNPANPGYPQYATDIGWAVKQVTQIKNMYNKLDNPLLKFNIVRYL